MLCWYLHFGGIKGIIMTEIYAKGLTKVEYYREWEEEHRQERNAYRRKRYREKCIRENL